MSWRACQTSPCHACLNCSHGTGSSGRKLSTQLDRVPRRMLTFSWRRCEVKAEGLLWADSRHRPKSRPLDSMVKRRSTNAALPQGSFEPILLVKQIAANVWTRRWQRAKIKTSSRAMNATYFPSLAATPSALVFKHPKGITKYVERFASRRLAKFPNHINHFNLACPHNVGSVIAKANF